MRNHCQDFLRKYHNVKAVCIRVGEIFKAILMVYIYILYLTVYLLVKDYF